MADAKNKLITPEFRGSYVHLVKPKKVAEDSAERYSMMIVLPKKSKATRTFIKRLEQQIDKATAGKFGKKIAHARLKHFPIQDGDEMVDDDGKTEEQFEGCYCINAYNTWKPGVVDSSGNELFEEDDIYSGAWFRASIDVWAWDHKTGGKGVSINLNNVLKVKDDEKFTSRSNAAEDFGDYIGDDDDDDDDDDLLG